MHSSIRFRRRCCSSRCDCIRADGGYTARRFAGGTTTNPHAPAIAELGVARFFSRSPQRPATTTRKRGLHASYFPFAADRPAAPALGASAFVNCHVVRRAAYRAPSGQGHIGRPEQAQRIVFQRRHPAAVLENASNVGGNPGAELHGPLTAGMTSRNAPSTCSSSAAVGRSCVVVNRRPTDPARCARGRAAWPCIPTDRLPDCPSRQPCSVCRRLAESPRAASGKTPGSS